VRSFAVGPNNPNFRSLSQITVLLQSTILLAEDDAFFYHKGFLIESIKYALAQDIKQHKLFRGGSTISQQLIKNVYLSHEKSIARKLEEVILVWLIESNRLVSKSRMYEVYLNIIEWGPGVYGANEAAHFYFNKDVAYLNPEECIFLASVIPSPRKFYYRFDKEGNLAPFMMAYFSDMSEKLAHRGLITVSENDPLALKLKITGPAKNFLQRNIYSSDSIKIMDIPALESNE
jgi:membrane peptidoglycan carboxypeptidase